MPSPLAALSLLSAAAQNPTIRPAASASVLFPGETATTTAATPSATASAMLHAPSASAATPSSAELRKLKRRVDPAKRKRIALACDSCKRRKQKCNGDHPCSICQKKNFVCHYTPTRADLLPGRTPSVSFSSPSPKESGADDRADSVRSDSPDADPRAASDHERAEKHTHRPHRKRHRADASTSAPRHNNGNESSASDASDSTAASPDTSLPSPPEVQQHQQQHRYHRKRSHSRAEYQVETVGDGRNTRLLWDEKGHLRYMGESGVLSFLEQSRKAFRKVMGDSSFTLDPAQFRFIDGPTHTASIIPLQLPPRSLTNELIQAFDDNVQAFDYVFDMDQFRYQVAQTYRNPMGAPRHWLCLLHFTCALGAIFVTSKQELDTEKITITPFSAISDSQQAPANTAHLQHHAAAAQKESSGSRGLVDPALFFESGLGLMNDAAEDGELWVVQAYLLMCLYYQIICKRNASWIQLGSAIRFAQALGMHRKCVNMTFAKPQRIMRQRIWRTLYIQDRFWSSSLGRPLAIDDTDWDDRDISELVLLDRTVVELSKLSEIIGDICLLVYRPQSISSSTSQRLATRLREWSDGLPAEIQLSSLSLTSSAGMGADEARRLVIRNQGLLRLHLTHLNSIILLTRPFFLLMVAKTPTEIPAQAKTVSRLSSACVLCAARSVDLVMTFFAQNQQPIRSHLMTYFIFTAGIVLLLESFHQRRSEVESYITRGIFLCIFILGHYGKIDPSAKRYRNILQEMDRAARASRSLNYTAPAQAAAAADAANTQKKHIIQINSLLNSTSSTGGSGMPEGTAQSSVLSTGTETSGGTFHFMPTPRNSSVRSETVPRSKTVVGDSHAVAAAAAAAAAAQAYQQAANPDYDDEKYLHDMLGYGSKMSGADSTTNLSRMFLKAAANDGRYHIPDSPLPGIATPRMVGVDDERGGIAMPSAVASILPPPARASSAAATAASTAANTPGSSRESTLNISPADAMSQFLMDDNFGVGANGAEEPNLEFSFDLDMMDWINLASGGNTTTGGAGGGTASGAVSNVGTGTAVGTPAATTVATPANSGANPGSHGFEEAVRRANAELFNGPGGSRQGVGAATGSSSSASGATGASSMDASGSGSGVGGSGTATAGGNAGNGGVGQAPFYGADTVFRGLMMNAEY
ncbi:fungal-specific transcription factor domain-containing protein [Limtongia smithiae]|uniref:fungal-specific transcription factor domain-containing protein n=1 Tax=Limtongia smithiae TaxID=1125753 RepID=UPI0034CE15BF